MSTPTPVLVLPQSPQLTQPYLTPAQFIAYPTWMDLDNLVPGGLASLQTDALADALLAASAWADDICEGMRLSAHYVQAESLVTRASAAGRIYLRPRDIPVRGITAISYGADPASMTSASLVQGQTVWVDQDGRNPSFRAGGGLGQVFTGTPIQFGAAPAPSMVSYVTWSYVAGFPSTVLAAALTSGTSSATVADPTGILPGDVLRLYDLGKTEAVTVASTYAPQNPTVPPTATAIPLAAPAVSSHDAGTGITGLPRKVLQAVIALTVALLMREDVSAEEPSSAFGPAARSTGGGERGGAASGLVDDAERWLATLRPVFRS